jgi:hypothetical protein
MTRFLRHHRFSTAATLFGLLLAGCHNAYAPPTNGSPENWGEQHYLDNQRNQEQIENRMQD